jgi:hypothetical protein
MPARKAGGLYESKGSAVFVEASAFRDFRDGEGDFR